ncbi:hypothetical protein ACFY4I_30840 [Streptomyces scabiei]|uniref:hypothetical protein n=1 Tax=Streptomyces scabiei TaxID=1930 RepID=UPI00369F9604
MIRVPEQAVDRLNDPYEFSVGVPSVEVFRRLRTDAGLSDKDPEAAALTEARECWAPTTAYVSLIADGPARFLYEKFGFADTATHDSIGMYRVLDGGPGLSGSQAEP